MANQPELANKQAGRELRRIVFSEDQIQARVVEMGLEITEAHGPDEEILVLGLLKGSFIFMADLVRRINRPLQVDFLVASSYGNATESSGDVKLLYDSEASLEGRSVILVEDIIDSGTTLNRLLPLLEKRGPRRLEVCALLHKNVAALDREPRWVGFDAPKEFLVGYGLDYSENFRHLPLIGSL
ncbi:hypoxanthine phosphoribosyltransferase [Gemmatimonadota bacterium]